MIIMLPQCIFISRKDILGKFAKKELDVKTEFFAFCYFFVVLMFYTGEKIPNNIIPTIVTAIVQ